MKEGDTVIVLGSGPIGLMAQKFAWQRGAERVVAVDHYDYRLQHAKKFNRVETFDFTKDKDLGETLKELTKGGADVVIDCVGMDGKKSPLEYVAQKVKLQGGTLGAIQIATKAVKKGGIVQLTGVYGGLYNVFPLGPFFARNVILKMGQAPARSYMDIIYHQLANSELDPSDIITHTLPLDEASQGYKLFNDREDDCIKVILKP